ncbi:hypothetical protein JCM17844_13000 [Iodidimonas gelatinilytica]|uniref:C4-dicarboxylate ABC transporter substrate-binding protein n=1 Tax=Iodidimonas gelatinilytica TaxID=1236966 RepID=A0A5A7MR27_9PROT|nr:TAXI family TRAP transporter solute-binding subunit [Iodidimonas gelatinilytica]GEQ97663.1 hypothetical protein JCM17844_13000 [Iodidimonas gelatinilytica]
MKQDPETQEPQNDQTGPLARRLAALPSWLSEGLGIGLPSILLLVIAFYAAFQFVEPAPPRHLTILAGSKGGTYSLMAARYREALAKSDIAVTIVETAGSQDNLERLATSDPDDAIIAFVQAGVAPPIDAPKPLEALASLYFEPAWLFLRDDVKIQDVRDLEALTVAIGAAGSGSRALAAELYRLNGLPVPDTALSHLSGNEAVTALILGQVDAVFTVGGAPSQDIDDLLHQDGVTLFSLPRAAAYARKFGYVRALDLPEGAVDLARNIPAQNTRLIGTTAQLVARRDLHPALVDRLLMVANTIHDQAGLFETAGQFPSPYMLSLPLNDEAARFHRRGPSFLQRILPFWAATMLDRWLVMALPLLTLLIPLLRIVPPLYSWRIKARISRPYKALRAIEKRAAHQDIHRDKALAELDAIEKGLGTLSVPPTHAGELYALKFHIQMLRDSLGEPKKKKPHTQNPEATETAKS